MTARGDGQGSPLRRAARWLRHLPDRMLHARRRREAEAAARRLPGLHRIVVLCHGNICRSPYAEAAIRAGLAARGLRRVDVRSAGFIGPDRPAPATALEAAAARGRNLSAHRSRLVGPGDLVTGTLVLVMDLRQRDAILRLAPPGVEVALLGDFDPEPIGRRNILDPIECPRPVFDAVYERLDRCVAGLLDAVAPAIPAPPRTPAP